MSNFILINEANIAECKITQLHMLMQSLSEQMTLGKRVWFKQNFQMPCFPTCTVSHPVVKGSFVESGVLWFISLFLCSVVVEVCWFCFQIENISCCLPITD